MTGVQWVGRTAESPEGEIRLGFPGVTAIVRFNGTWLKWEVDASSVDCYFNVSIDGKPSRILRADVGRSTVVLASGLEGDRPHIVRIVRRNESWQGVVRVLGVTTDGQLLEAPPLPTRKLLFIGDSITCGAAVDHMPPDFPEGAINCDADGSFGMELSRRLDAQAHLVAYGGRGLVRDYQGWGSDRTLISPVMFERAMPDDESSVWNHNRYAPDAIIVGVGTNDFAIGIPDEVAWVAAYDAFLTRIREVHPAAYILITNSPMFSSRIDNGDFAKAAAIGHFLDEIIAKRWHVGDRRVEKSLFRHQPGSGKNSHPCRPQHQLMADDLEHVIRARMGWQS